MSDVYEDGWRNGCVRMVFAVSPLPLSLSLSLSPREPFDRDGRQREVWGATLHEGWRQMSEWVSGECSLRSKEAKTQLFFFFFFSLFFSFFLSSSAPLARLGGKKAYVCPGGFSPSRHHLRLLFVSTVLKSQVISSLSTHPLRGRKGGRERGDGRMC